MTERLHHATAIASANWAVLLVGPSGVGKSDLALRMIDRGWMLLADDLVLLEDRGGQLLATAPLRTRGLMEVRGLGLHRFPAAHPAPVALVADLHQPAARLPERETVQIAGITLAHICVDPRPASAPIRLELAFAGVLKQLMSERP